jgi:hypothetical protein
VKLYNLFEEVILEQTGQLLVESVSEQQVIDAIKNKYHVHILYDDYPDRVPSVPPSKRYIEVYNLGLTKAGNKAIRAWQMGGPSKTTKGGAWKMFRLDRIRAWMPTKVKWNRTISDLYPNDPNIPKYNKTNGGDDKLMTNIIAKADIAGPTLTISKTQKPKQKPYEKLLAQRLAKKDSAYVAKGNAKPNVKPSPLDTSKTTAPKNNKIEKIET